MLPPDVRRALQGAGVDDIRDDRTARAAYSSDASLYRLVPEAVIGPRSTDDVLTVVAVAREFGLPVTARGGGTSVAGNAIGRGLILDFSRHLNRIIELDVPGRRAVVQPGLVQADLQAAAVEHGLRFGPDPSTASRCTIGGMIGNDACGSRSLAYGRTSHNVDGLTLVTGTGEVLHTDRLLGTATGFEAGQRALREVVGTHLGVLRTELGTFGRQISGYALHQALPENRFDLTRMLVGSEGTLGLVTEATVRLVPDARHRVLVVLGYPDMPTAADDVPALLPLGMSACEGLDSRIVDVVRIRRGAHRVPALPTGRAWLLVEIADSETALAHDRAAEVVRTAGCLDSRIVSDAAEKLVLWRIREDGAGLAGRAPSGKPAWAGWEDAAVPPAALGGYLRDFDLLLTEYHLTAMPFGHFGEGCVHVRLDFDLGSGAGVDRMREFLVASARLVARHGGSLSGEHGDGRARSELLPYLYSAEVLRTFAAVKDIFDPDRLLNPGVLVDPDPLNADLRVPVARRPRETLALAYISDGGDFRQAVHRCTGVGSCRSTVAGAGTVMCPSFAATGAEQDSTRGRARLLQEMLNGELVNGWRDPALHEALDLCLSCKGCASDCPTGVDMAAYKAEVLHQTYRRRLRPRSHYALGWLPRWARIAAIAPGVANALTRHRLTRRAALFLAGVDTRRTVPAFAARTFRRSAPTVIPAGPPVTLFVDTFTDHFTPEVGEAVMQVMRAAGYTPTLSSAGLCCGLTWISTGQLDAARRQLARTVAALAPFARSGVPIVGIEPSCTAALRHDAVQLLDSDDARLVAGAVVTLAELLARTPTWTPPRLDGTTVLAQPHCHHHAVMGWDADQALLLSTGATLQRVGGCCGLAGNFGVERGHYDVSVAVANLQLLPALAAADQASDNGQAATTTVLADGFSCRTQISDLTSHRSLHLAELLARQTPDQPPTPVPEPPRL